MQKINNSPQQVYKIIQSDFALLEFLLDQVHVPLAWSSLSSVSPHCSALHWINSVPLTYGSVVGL